MNRSYRADYDVKRSSYWQFLEDTFKRNDIKTTTDKKAVWTITRVLEGKESSADPKINAIAADLCPCCQWLIRTWRRKESESEIAAGKVVAYLRKRLW